MKRASASALLPSVLVFLLGAVSAGSVAAAPSDTLALDARNFSYDAAHNNASASVDNLDLPPASTPPDAVAGWSAGAEASLLRPAGDLVAPSGVADDGARFVVDSTGSTVLRAQGPQGWINVSEHAARRMTQRGIPIDAVDNALTTQSFDYFHAGVTKTGFYDAANNLFVGTVDDVVTTVFHPSAGQGYIDNLLAAGP